MTDTIAPAVDLITAPRPSPTNASAAADRPEASNIGNSSTLVEAQGAIARHRTAGRMGDEEEHVGRQERGQTDVAALGQE
ncbi:hypothetical protein ACIBP6_23030 [Nonomuraea terrae]|uniref:hypothetical protein n=1 Tax=Nonomuraea terrae TaxID=2530383 RepID=UPI00379453C6